MTVLLLGNRHTAEATRDPETDEVSVEFTEADDENVTTVVFPDGLSIAEMFQTLTLPGGVATFHFAEVPTWVECDDSPGLAALVAEHYGIEIRKGGDE